MDDSEFLAAVRGLVDKEHALRSRMEAGGLDAADEQPEAARVRDVRTVEGYRQ